MSMNELKHYGVKGQRWGVRRYQKKDGSLTPLGKKRISKEYEKESKKLMSDFAARRESMYVNAYNKAADKMNRGGIDKFNKEQADKYGKDYAKRDGYTEDYMRMFEKEMARIYDKSLMDFYNSSASYKKTQALVEKYDMTSWDELARKNSEVIQDLRRAIEENKE
jgi:hypothetical protein